MIEILKQFGEVLADVSLKNYNTYKIASTAKFLVMPNSVEDLINLISYLRNDKTSYIILGNGSNVVLDDGYYDGVIIKLSKIDEIKINGLEIYAGAGIMLPKLAREVIDNNLKGLEWASSIPGTLGGSIVGNAGAYKESIFDFITKVVIVDGDLNIREISKEDIDYSYRYSSFKDNKDLIVVGAYLELEEGNKEESLEIVNKRMKKRLETQPLDYPSAGSVFRNPENDFAGRIIEEDLNFKGKTIGGAMVSEKHANFIINYDNATGKDVRQLVNLIKKEAKEKAGIELIQEQEFIDWK